MRMKNNLSYCLAKNEKQTGDLSEIIEIIKADSFAINKNKQNHVQPDYIVTDYIKLLSYRNKKYTNKMPCK